MSTQNRITGSRAPLRVPGVVRRKPLTVSARILTGIGAAALALLVWQIASAAVAEPMILPAPLAVLTRVRTSVADGTLPAAVLYTLRRVATGFALGLIAGALLVIPAARFRAVETLLRPYLFTVRAVPVASFVVPALVWVGGARLSVLISFLMVMPIVYANLLEGVRHTDPALLEAAAVFDFSPKNRFVYLYVPGIKPYLLSACETSLGLAWKAGVAAEMIGIPAGSVGEHMYLSKVWLDTEGVFAITAVIVAVSILCGKAFMALLRYFFRLWELL